jgi:hypothetical protein
LCRYAAGLPAAAAARAAGAVPDFAAVAAAGAALRRAVASLTPATSGLAAVGLALFTLFCSQNTI